MLIWLDGTYGVGKSSVANELMEIMTEVIIMNADTYYSKMMKEGLINIFGGTTPQNKKDFLLLFRSEIEQALLVNPIVVVDMALTQPESKALLYDYFDTDKTIHIILTADTNCINQRIDNCKERDVLFAKSWKTNNEQFLANNYSDGLVIDTTYLSISETAKQIQQIICQSS